MTRYIPDDNLSYPVLIEIGDGSGSGFFFRAKTKLYLATAKHVLYSNDQLSATTMTLTHYPEDRRKQKIITTVNLATAPVRKSTSKDVALVELADMVEIDGQPMVEWRADIETNAEAESNTVVVPAENLKKLKDVLISNEVIIMGFPNSLGDENRTQIEYDKPLLRKGIVAGINNSNKTIILDCPVYFGNSGGLAIEIEEINGKRVFKVIGIVSQFVPFYEQILSLHHKYINKSVENSGYSIVVPIDTILQLTKDAPEETAKVEGEDEIIKLNTSSK